jgi:outer membrane protein TolC
VNDSTTSASATSAKRTPRLETLLCLAVAIAAAGPSPVRAANAAATPPAPAATAQAPAVTAPATAATAPATAATPPGLDANATVRFALDHNPTVVADRAALANAVATFTSRRAAEFPSVVGQLSNQMQKSANLQGNLAAYGLTQQSVFSQNTAQLASQYTLYNGSLTQIQAQEARRQVESTRGTLRRAEQQAAADATAGFYNLAGKRTAVVLAEFNRRYQQALLDAARASERVGRVPGVDVLRAQVGVTRSEAALVSARADEENTREALAQLIGAPLETHFILPEQIPEPKLPETPVDVLISIAQANRPDVAAARANLAVAVLSYSAINTDLLPQVTLNGSFGNQVTPTAYGPQQASIDQQNAINASQGLPLVPNITRGQPGFWQISANATLSIPIIDYGTRHTAHTSASAQIASADSALTQTLSSVELDVRQSLRAAQTAFTNLKLYAEAVEFGRESARIAGLQYKNGLISFTDAEATSQTALSSANDLVAARVTYLVSIVRLRISIGDTDPATAADVRGL